MMFGSAKLPTFLLQITQIFSIFYENIPQRKYKFPQLNVMRYNIHSALVSISFQRYAFLMIIRRINIPPRSLFKNG